MAKNNSNELEQKRQLYLLKLAQIISEEELTPAEATQLAFAEIASWLAVIAELLTIPDEDGIEEYGSKD